MKYLSPVDASFIRMESVRTPMHVGGLLTFKLPKNAPPDFLRQLLKHMREQPFMPAPFDSKLVFKGINRLAPAWVKTRVDTDYHVRHSALPYPGGERELGVLIARLHSNPMDFTRPLWEAHLIEGLENHRFGLYFKAHHCAIDGMGAMNMIRHWLSEDPNDTNGPGPWIKPSSSSPGTRSKPSVLGKIRGNAKAISELGETFYKLAQGGDESVLRAAATTPRSLINVRISQQRRLGTQLLDLSRFKAISKATGATVNDVSLAIIAGALRRYMLERDALPEASLTASIPIGLPRKDDSGGNAVTGFVCPLATQEADPVKRLQTIHSVTDRTKHQMLEMSPTALEQFALLGLTPLILGQMSGRLYKLPPFFNLVVSNVVASKGPLYLMGAELEAMYPVSFLFDGYGLNVTIIGYNGKVSIGFLGCREALPSLQRLAVYSGEALTELEEALGLTRQPAPTASAPAPKPASTPAAPAPKRKKSAPAVTQHKTSARKTSIKSRGAKTKK